MKKIATALAGTVLLLTAFIGLSGTPALADNPPPGGIPARDGNLWAWDKEQYSSSIFRPVACHWQNQSANWEDCRFFGGAFTMRNAASSLYNNSSGNRPVNLYFHPSFTGAWACLGPGDYWDDLTRGRTFSWGPGRDGYQTGINDEIASHRWRTPGSACGNANP